LASLGRLHLNVVLFKLSWAISNKFNHVLFITLKKGKEKYWLVIASTISVKRDRTTEITKTTLKKNPKEKERKEKGFIIGTLQN
jgi:hypothetical protein